MSSYDEDSYDERKRRKHKRKEEHKRELHKHHHESPQCEESSDSEEVRKKHKKRYQEEKVSKQRHPRRTHSGSDDSGEFQVKQEHSDDEYERRHRERPRRPEHPVRVKEEPVSDEERDPHRRRHDDKGRRDHKRHNNGRREEDRYRHERQANDERRVQDKTKRSKWQNSPEDDNMQFGNQDSQGATNDQEQATDKEKPNFSLSGKLTEDTNTYKGVVIKYSEPPEARKPKRRWRLYPFKGEQALPVLHIHRQSAYLLGRERKIADIPVDHPSCSKQHAVLQYRLVPYEREDGSKGHRVCPYIIDLESANGTYVNNQRIDPKRYVQLMEKDVLKFGFSSREYVILHDNSDTSELHDEGVE